MAKTYVIQATPKVLERVYYAIERCKSSPQTSAQTINREVSTRFGAPISTAIWTTINAARRDGSLSRIKTKSFDFAKHGRSARTGKSKRYSATSSKPTDRRASKSRRSTDNTHRFPLDSNKHPRYTVATWEKGKRKYKTYRTRKEVDRALRRLLRSGVTFANIAIYKTEPITLKLAVKD